MDNKFNISQLQVILENKGLSVPSNDSQFRAVFSDRSVPMQKIKLALVESICSETGKDEEAAKDYIGENFPGRADMIEEFLRRYEVVYDVVSENAGDSTDETDSDTDAITDNSDEFVNSSSDNGFGYDVTEIDIDTIPSSIGNINNVSYPDMIMPDDDNCDMSVNEANLFLSANTINIDTDINYTSPDIRKDMNITENSNFKVQYKGMCLKYAFILSDDYSVIASGHIMERTKENGTEYYFVADKKNICFERFNDKRRFKLVLIKGDVNSDFSVSGTVVYNDINIDIKEANETSRCLCIDFGTSNTSAGTYGIINENGREPEIVEFSDVVNGNEKTYICPTIVYVKDCSDRNNIKYLFGHEARKRIIGKKYSTEASVFYDIKSWVGDDSEIDIYDELESQNKLRIKKSTIVKAYIDYIIDKAEAYFSVKFTKLHFSAPVKMKSKFLVEMTSMYDKRNGGKYTVFNEKESVDEAVAIIYDYIYDRINFYDMRDKEYSEKVVVLDCGGGTTDLATCEFSSIPSGLDANGIERVRIKTHFEKGKPDFGGNNITFKIMQLTKIKIANALGWISDEECEDVLSKSEKDILGEIDEYRADNPGMEFVDSSCFYSDLKRIYEKCERFIPTRFSDNSEHEFESDKNKMKRNFYFLWQYAENIKFAFYKEDKVQVEFRDPDKKIVIPNIEESNYLYIYENEWKEVSDPLGKINISIKEIEKLICGDIYLLLNEILPERPDEYDHYKLSGQSCKINLFTDLLKEFIPGRKLREKMSVNASGESSIMLKLKCIRGSIIYRIHRECGYYDSTITMDAPGINYNVMSNETNLYNIETGEAFIYGMTDQQVNCDLVVARVNSDKRVKITYNTEQLKNQYACCTLSELKKYLISNTYGVNIDLLINKIMSVNPIDDKYRMLMALPSVDGYGFYVYTLIVYRENNILKYKLSKPKYYDFDMSHENFFDGKR